MPTPQITSLVNPLDGRTVEITLAAAPSGTLHVYASRLPGAPGEDALDAWEEALIDSLGSNTYRVYVPWPVSLDSAPEPFHFIAQDNVGYSVSRDALGNLVGQKCAWVGHTNSDDFSAIMEQLHQRVLDNRDAITARLQQIEPDSVLQQVIWGMGQKLTAYPCIEINHVALAEPYEVAPMGRLARVQAELYGYVVHQVETVQARLGAAFGRALQHILNQEGYEQMRIGNKIVTACQATTLKFDNNVWNGEKFVDSFSLAWEGQYGEYLP